MKNIQNQKFVAVPQEIDGNYTIERFNESSQQYERFFPMKKTFSEDLAKELAFALNRDYYEEINSFNYEEAE